MVEREVNASVYGTSLSSKFPSAIRTHRNGILTVGCARLPLLHRHNDRTPTRNSSPTM